VNASTFSDKDIAALAATHDIIDLGMRADEVRRNLHGLRTTFVRVADVPIEGAAPVVPASAGEIRIVGTPATREAAVERVRAVAAVAGGRPLSAFSLADLERMAAVERITLRALLEELCAAGLELVADAPFDRLQDPRRSIEEVNISGLALGRPDRSASSGSTLNGKRSHSISIFSIASAAMSSLSAATASTGSP